MLARRGLLQRHVRRRHLLRRVWPYELRGVLRLGRRLHEMLGRLRAHCVERPAAVCAAPLGGLALHSERALRESRVRGRPVYRPLLLVGEHRRELPGVRQQRRLQNLLQRLLEQRRRLHAECGEHRPRSRSALHEQRFMCELDVHEELLLRQFRQLRGMQLVRRVRIVLRQLCSQRRRLRCAQRGRDLLRERRDLRERRMRRQRMLLLIEHRRELRAVRLALRLRGPLLLMRGRLFSRQQQRHVPRREWRAVHLQQRVRERHVLGFGLIGALLRCILRQLRVVRCIWLMLLLQRRLHSQRRRLHVDERVLGLRLMQQLRGCILLLGLAECRRQDVDLVPFRPPRRFECGYRERLLAQIGGGLPGRLRDRRGYLRRPVDFMLVVHAGRLRGLRPPRCGLDERLRLVECQRQQERARLFWRRWGCW